MEISPDKLMAIFKDIPRRPVHMMEILDALGIPSAHRRLVLQMLRGLVREGKLVGLRKKYFILPEPVRRVEGEIHVSGKGAGFLLGGAVDGSDLYIHASNLGSAIDGDRVEAEIFAGARGRDEGRVSRVVDRAHKTIIGQFSRNGKAGTVVPRNARIGRWMSVSNPPPAREIPDGAWVLAKVLNWPEDPASPLPGEIEEVLGKEGERGISVLVLLRDMGVNPDFPAEVLREAEALARPAVPEEGNHRLDLRDLVVFTIDPATAKDFDDALSIARIEGDHWRLGVHIADVSHYVTRGSALDEEALRRATSIYPVDRVVPMLPERLSNELCSLRPREDRYAMSVFMDIDRQGNVLRYEIANSIIHSRHRLSYEEVQAYFDKPNERASSPLREIGEELQELLQLSRILTNMRMQRGALDLDLSEAEVECNEAGDTVGLHRRIRLDSHRLVEECMLAANETVARHLRKMRFPMLYRIHDVPDPGSLAKIAPVLRLFGVRVPKRIQPSPEFYQPIVDRLHQVDGGHIAQQMLLRTLMRAEYSAENRGHFGLASECYCHFTSPIRRYPDLHVHRMLKAWLEGKGSNPEWKEAHSSDLGMIADQSNRMAERATDIEREAGRIKAMELMRDHVGNIFEGWVSGIARRGCFIELVDLPVEGFLLAAGIPGDIFAPDKDNLRLIGRNTGRTYTLGKRVKVRVVRVSEIDGEMDLELVESGLRTGGKKRKKGKKGR